MSTDTDNTDDWTISSNGETLRLGQTRFNYSILEDAVTKLPTLEERLNRIELLIANLFGTIEGLRVQKISEQRPPTPPDQVD